MKTTGTIGSRHRMQRAVKIGRVNSACRALRWPLAMLLLTSAATLAAQATPLQDDADSESDSAVGEAQPSQDERAYPASTFVLEYVRPNPGLPDMESLMWLPITLGRVDDGFVAPREGAETVTVTLGELNGMGSKQYYFSALQRILETLRDEFTRQQLMGVFVSPDPAQIQGGVQDVRAAGDTTLRIMIAAGIVTELRTLGSGRRVPTEDRVNNPLHDAILSDSPIQAESGDEPEGRSLLRRDVLDDYIYFKSRHPGRRIDVSIAAGAETGGAALDYHISENRPLVLYAQISNTGTKETNYWRQRFGLIQTQLTNNDDVLSLDYSTASFDETHALQSSYEFPSPWSDRVRFRVFGEWSQYTASDVGIGRDIFTGETWAVGGELIANVYQYREFFLDLLVGARYEDVEVDNIFAQLSGGEEFFLPYIGARIDQTTDWYSLLGSAVMEFHLPSVTGVDSREINRLGRLFPDDEWARLRFNMTNSFYLEPLLNRAAFEDPTTPKSSTLAHEIVLAVQGQVTFGNRMIPQKEMVAGGLYTVRGYPESVAAGDKVLIGSLEYRFHVPRTFDVQPQPRELFGEAFRAAPQYVYGRPDWDLVLKGFVDIGRTFNERRLPFEHNETLIGAGVGVDFIYKRSLNVRLDWGFVLEGLDGANVDAGSNRLHFVTTFLF